MKKEHIIIERLDAMHTKLQQTMNDLQVKGIETKDVLSIASVADEIEHLIKPSIQYQIEQAQPKTINIHIESLCKGLHISTGVKSSYEDLKAELEKHLLSVLQSSNLDLKSSENELLDYRKEEAENIMNAHKEEASE